MSHRKQFELFVFDLDGTLLKSCVSILFYKYALKHFLLPWTSIFRCLYLYCRYKLFFCLPSFHHDIFKTVFFNKSLLDLSQAGANFFREFNWKKQFYFPALDKLREAQTRGAYTAIFSSSPDFLVIKLAKLFRVDFVLASSYVCSPEGKCTRIFNFVDGSVKKKYLKKLSNRLKIKKIYAFSDSITDLDFLETASVPCAVRPDRMLKKTAISKNWSII